MASNEGSQEKSVGEYSSLELEIGQLAVLVGNKNSSVYEESQKVRVSGTLEIISFRLKME